MTTMETQEDVPVPARVAHWMEMVRMAHGTVTYQPQAALAQRAERYFERELRRAIANAIAGKESDAAFLRRVADEGLTEDPNALARLRLIADAIDQPEWIDVDDRLADRLRTPAPVEATR